MTDDKMENEIHNEVTKEVHNEVPDVIGALFDERDLPSSERVQSGVEEASKTTASSPKEEKKTVASSEKPMETHKPSSDEGDESESPDETARLKSDLEQARKTITENQRYGRQKSQQLKQVRNVVQDMENSGVLTRTEAQSLLDVLSQDPSVEDTEESEPASTHPFAPIFKVANQELEHLRKYSNDAHLEAKVNAFDYFLAISSPDEVQEAFEELIELIDDPLQLTRKMLEIGQKAYEDSFEEIHSAGGFKSFMLKKKEEIEKLNKKIDKLEKKLSQYEDYDTPRYRISGMSDINEKSSQRDTISALFEERDRPRQVAR